MRVDMKREFSGWDVMATGGLLALAGAYWLIAGWEHIQIERGWSQFIAGAMALSGGVITVAIGRLIRLLVTQSDVIGPVGQRQALTAPSARSDGRGPEPQKSPKSNRQARPAIKPAVGAAFSNLHAPISNETLESKPDTPALPARNYAWMSSATLTQSVADAEDWRRPDARHSEAEQPTEVDRYTAGDSTYVMYTDGSVEVHRPDGVRLYESLDDLRASSGER